MKNQNNDTYSLAHTTWKCQYHIVFTPKYHRKIIYVALVGNRAIDFVNSIHADITFMSCFGVNKNGDIYDIEDDEISVRCAMLNNANKKILLVDKEKFGRQASFKLANISDFDQVVCDKKPENFFDRHIDYSIIEDFQV